MYTLHEFYIWPAANKSIPRFLWLLYDICITFYAIYDEIIGAAHGWHFPYPYEFRLSYQTYHFETVPFSTIERSTSILFTTGIFTKVDYLRINGLYLP